MSRSRFSRAVATPGVKPWLDRAWDGKEHAERLRTISRWLADNPWSEPEAFADHLYTVHCEAVDCRCAR